MSLSRRDFVRISSLVPLAYVSPFSKGLTSLADLTAPISLYGLFKEPPSAARPFVRWWWNGGRISEQELLRELDILKSKGISGVEINTIAFPEKNQPMGHEAHEWLGDEWIRLLKVTLDGAKQRGITCDIIVGSGWPFGGEFLNKDEQIQLMALGSRQVTGPQKLTVKKAELLSEMDALMTYKKGYMELASLRLAPNKMEAFTPGTDLKSQLNSDEIIIDVPAGDHTLYYTVKLTGYTAVTHGAPGASGPVLNHFSKPAVQKYLDRMSTALNSKIGPMGEHFRSVFVDSQELRGSNWCDDMFSEFKRRRGYDLEPYLPFVLFKINRKSTYNGGQEFGDAAGFSAQVQDQINRIRHDFEVTRLELYDERFLKTFTGWCRANKVKSRVQAYGREYYTLESAMQLDIPECETWLRKDVGGPLDENSFKNGRGYRPVNKFASSAARLTGKPIVSAEEITNTAMVFNATLERIKVTGDQSNLSGVNHSILHGFNYSPADVPFPGWVRYGTFFNERNTWWPYLNTWIDYKSRLSAVFQAGQLQSNIAVMFPTADMWSKYGLQYQQYPQIVYPEYATNIWEAIHQNGSGCDYLTESVLQKAKFSSGALHYGPRSYKILMLAGVESIAPETADALQKFAAAGGLIIFIDKEPSKGYGWKGHEARDAKVAASIKALKSTYPKKVGSFPAPGDKIIDWFAQLQLRFNITPFVKIDKPVNYVSQNHYKTPDADVFFITNYSLENAHQFTATFNVKRRTAWVWDAETGEKFIYPTDGSWNRLKIDLDPAESILIAFTDEAKGESYQPKRPQNIEPGLTLQGPWNVTLEKVYDKPRNTTFDKLKDLKDDAELKSFAGVIYYEKQFDVSDAKAHQYLNLGDVFGISEVTLNGKPLGFKWYGRHIYDTKGSLQRGNNVIKIKVTTVLGNYAKSLTDNEVAQQWTKNQPLYSLGLVGPVTLI